MPHASAVEFFLSRYTKEGGDEGTFGTRAPAENVSAWQRCGHAQAFL